jgi:MoxR-like ATPase
LDWRAATTVRGEDVIVGERVMFWVTENVGSHYTGTFPMDAAFKRRSNGQLIVKVPPNSVEVKILMEKEEVSEEQAVEIVRMFTILRNSGLDASAHIMTGNALNVAKLVRLGASLRKAFQYAVINMAPEDMLHVCKTPSTVSWG